MVRVVLAFWLYLCANLTQGLNPCSAFVGIRSKLLLRCAQAADQSPSSFASLSSGLVPQWLLDSCTRLGFDSPTEVQKEALPVIFKGNDVVLQAMTGSGKTLAYGLPVLSKIDASRAAIQAVIVVPTRELGLQVAAVMKQLATGSPKRIMIMPLVEGSKNRRQQLWATAEPPHIIVGNPRALQRLVDMGRLRLNSVSFVVLDEVDACLISPETRQDLHKLLSQKLSNSYQSANMEDLLDDAAAGGLQESLVYTDLAASHRDLSASQQQYRSSRQTILCSATVPQRQQLSGRASQSWRRSATFGMLCSDSLRTWLHLGMHWHCDNLPMPALC